MREIIFRGKRVDNGSWEYGDFRIQNDGNPDRVNYLKTYIMPRNVVGRIEVVPETVGQYTGLKDKSGKMIFEGDKIKAYFLSNRSKQEFKVSFERGSFLFDNSYVKANERDLFSLEVIGNIHDNPELIIKDE